MREHVKVRATQAATAHRTIQTCANFALWLVMIKESHMRAYGSNWNQGDLEERRCLQAPRGW